MSIGAVARKDSVSGASRPSAPKSAAMTLAMSSDSLRFKVRDGAAPAAKEIPGLSKMQWGGGIASASIIGLSFSVLAAASAPAWLPWAFGAGIAVGGVLLLKGASEWAKDMTDKAFKMPEIK